MLFTFSVQPLKYLLLVPLILFHGKHSFFILLILSLVKYSKLLYDIITFNSFSMLLLLSVDCWNHMICSADQLKLDKEFIKTKAMKQVEAIILVAERTVSQVSGPPITL